MTGQVKLGFRWVSSVSHFQFAVCPSANTAHCFIDSPYCPDAIAFIRNHSCRVSYVYKCTFRGIRGKIFNPKMLLTLSDTVVVAILIGKFYWGNRLLLINITPDFHTFHNSNDIIFIL